MTDNFSEEEINHDNSEPSELELTAPELCNIDQIWTVVAKNRKVNKDWEDLMQRYRASASRCYQDLCTAPMRQKPSKVFPLRGKPYKGAWEYKVTSGDRVFYTFCEEDKKVFVYYAGKHPSSAPIP